MQSVPFAFCDSVCTLLNESFKNEINVLAGDNPSYRIWNAAAVENFEKRVLIDLHIDYYYVDEEWTYLIQKNSRPLSFQELKGSCDRMCIRLDNLEIGTRTSTIKSSIDEIRELCGFVAPCFQDVLLEISNDSELPDEILSLLLSVHPNQSFTFIKIDKCATPIEDFLLNVLTHSEFIHSLHIDAAGWSYELISTLKTFIVTAAYDELTVGAETAIFDVHFFWEFFWRTPADRKLFLKVVFLSNLDDVLDFEKSLQLPTAAPNVLKWRRDDNIGVELRWAINHDNCIIDFGF